MTTEFTDDPYEMLSGDDLLWPDSADPYAMARKAYDPANPEPLTQLLESDDPLVVRRGLYIFGSLGKKAANLVDVALKSTRHPDKMARNSLMDGMLCYTRDLTPSQIWQLLPLAEDDEELVRGKMVAVLGVFRMKDMREAIDLIENDQDRSRHEEGLNRLSCQPDETQEVFDEAMGAAPLLSTYLLASIQRIARRNENTLVPEYGGTDYIGPSAILNTKRLVAAARRSRAKQRSRE